MMPPAQRRLSPAFLPAKWRGTTNTDGDIIGISFDLADGSIVRLALDMESARHVSETLLEYAGPYWVRTNSQSDKSDGSPSRDGSPQEGQNV